MLCIKSKYINFFERLFAVNNILNGALMKQTIKDNWDSLRKDFLRCQKSSGGVVQIASVDQNGTPNMTPIGSLFLGKNSQAFFCNRFPRNLNENLKTNDQVCVIAMNGSKWFWMKSLFKGQFATCPGIKLYGRISQRRKIAKEEKEKWENLVKPFRFLKGHALLWKDMAYASDIQFDSYEYLKAGEMTNNTSICSLGG